MFFFEEEIERGHQQSAELRRGAANLYSIAEKLGISLDWLVCGKGPVYYKEMEAKDLAEIKKGVLQELLPDSSLDEIKDLLGHMNRIPLLRHEILVYFYKFKAEHKELMVEGKEEQA